MNETVYVSSNKEEITAS